MQSRRFIRHPSDIPIEYSLQHEAGSKTHAISDVGYGGLSFLVDEPIAIGQTVSLRIPSVRPDLHINAVVAWCRKLKQGYQVGLTFQDSHDSFTIRMVEQICHIEEYRQKMLREQGRHLSAREAAEEWIAQYAQDFPGTED